VPIKNSRIKPIETNYRGCRFRSRTEARRAVFFRALNLPYEYEKEGFDLAGTWYLPDFYLPTLACGPGYPLGAWLEVKGVQPSDDELEKCGLLAAGTEKIVLLMAGAPTSDETPVMYKFHHTEAGVRPYGPAELIYFVCYEPLRSNKGITHQTIRYAANIARSERFGT